jgi:hypothetical protein
VNGNKRDAIKCVTILQEFVLRGISYCSGINGVGGGGGGGGVVGAAADRGGGGGGVVGAAADRGGGGVVGIPVIPDNTSVAQ